MLDLEKNRKGQEKVYKSKYIYFSAIVSCSIIYLPVSSWDFCFSTALTLILKKKKCFFLFSFLKVGEAGVKT